MKILEGDVNITKVDLNSSQVNEVDDNIRRSRIKEIKNSKDLLQDKLFTLDEQVQKLIEDENGNQKKFNLKQYLDNFEKDKALAVSKTRKWEYEQKRRVERLEEMQEVARNKIKEKEEGRLNKIKEKEREREEAYKLKIQKEESRAKQRHDDIERLRDEWAQRNSTNDEYQFQRMEKEFLEAQTKQAEAKKNHESLIMQEKRNLMKPIQREELEEFSKKVTEERKRIMFEKERERLSKINEINTLNENLPKAETETYQKAVEQSKKQKECIEKVKLDKIYKSMKIKQFSKVVKTELLPKIDDNKRRELEKRIDKINTKVEHHKVGNSRKGRVLLKKRDPNKPNKYKWDLKINSSFDDNRNRSRSKSARSDSENSIRRKSRSRSGEKRKPMEKAPDYLTEMRVHKIQVNASVSGDMNSNKQSKYK